MLLRRPRAPWPHGATPRRFEELPESDAQGVREPHEAAHREVLHSELDALQVVRLQAEALSKILLGPSAFVSKLGEPPADVFERAIRIEPPHPSTVDLRRALKHCVV